MLYFDLLELLGEASDREKPDMKSLFSKEYVPFAEVEKQYLDLFETLH
ncbi:MAG: hypothetical protein IJ801_00440 [Lachnospiraceae bacterium]|nr:hypothetical protein [Lachnospiraceae bacterium]